MNFRRTLVVCSIQMLSSSVAYAVGDAPTFDGAKVSIPRVDTPSQIGAFQEVVLKHTAQGFSLVQAEELGKGRVRSIDGIERVEVVKTGARPVSVHLRVVGAPSCPDFTGPARVHQRLHGNTFEVGLSASIPQPSPPFERLCLAIYKPYRISIPLQTYGLSAGTYSYNVNGSTGTFVLENDNGFSDDCDVVATACGQSASALAPATR